VAQSVGYKYVMSDNADGDERPLITVQEQMWNSGRNFWKKHLDKTHDGLVLGAQLGFTADVDVYGDCCFLHRCYRKD
tara:strand:+ start:121 stop:351 length:231 start_codon:yes stop_codon:yes gene_type:complete